MPGEMDLTGHVHFTATQKIKKMRQESLWYEWNIRDTFSVLYKIVQSIHCDATIKEGALYDSIELSGYKTDI